jgi:tetratricopeptide (TPR) repeat protein
MKIAPPALIAVLCLAALPAAAETKSPPTQPGPQAAPPGKSAPADKAKPGFTDKNAPGDKAQADKAPGDKAKPKKAEVLPNTAAERDKLLSDLYAQLATAEDEGRARPLIAQIERLWLYYGSDTVGVLMDRSFKAIAEKKNDLALELLDQVVDIAPDYAEGWNRRAYVYYSMNDHERALGDLRRVLALEPNHFKALEGIGQIFKELGQKKAALEAYRKLEAINPNAAGVKDTVRDLTRDVDGQGI